MTPFPALLDDYIVAYVHWYDANRDSFARKRDDARAACLAYVSGLEKERDELRADKKVLQQALLKAQRQLAEFQP